MKVAQVCCLIVMLAIYYGLIRFLISSTNFDEAVFAIGLLALFTGLVAYFASVGEPH